MSGIALILRNQGYRISGCDNDITQKSVIELQKLGCIIAQGNNQELCHDPSIDIVVYSSAIKPNNPEILVAQQRGIPTISRAIMLAELMRTKFSIAIAGSHGKTTTTSLISHILMHAQLHPTVIVGGHLHTISSNALHGTGDFLVAEADESDRSLIYLHATFAVITNIDKEHLETYSGLDDIKETFMHFLRNIPFYGTAILCIDDPHINSLLPLTHVKTIKYGSHPIADLYYSDSQLMPDYSLFTLNIADQQIPMRLNMPGAHNILNSLAAIAVARQLGIDMNHIKEALATFPGVDRRFTFKGTFKGALVYDDYGHHPEEIKHTLLMARKKTLNQLTVIFQPHRFTRTKFLWQEFIDTFSQGTIDRLVITDIYPASESPIDGITSQRLVQELKKHNPNATIDFLPFQQDFAQIKEYLYKHTCPGDLILLQGAGKVNKLGPLICSTEGHIPSSQICTSAY